jgi:hypothetical protein
LQTGSPAHHYSVLCMRMPHVLKLPKLVMTLTSLPAKYCLELVGGLVHLHTACCMLYDL